MMQKILLNTLFNLTKNMTLIWAYRSPADSNLSGRIFFFRVASSKFFKGFKITTLCQTYYKSSQWHFHQDNTPVHNSILVTDYLTKLGTKTVPQPPYSPDLTPCDFWLFSKLRGCRYETIEEMKEAVTKVIDMLTQEDFHGAFQKLLERYKFIAAGGDFMCVLSIQVPIRKKSLETHLMILVMARKKYWKRKREASE